MTVCVECGAASCKIVLGHNSQKASDDWPHTHQAPGESHWDRPVGEGESYLGFPAADRPPLALRQPLQALVLLGGLLHLLHLGGWVRRQGVALGVGRGQGVRTAAVAGRSTEDTAGRVRRWESVNQKTGLAPRTGIQESDHC